MYNHLEGNMYTRYTRGIYCQLGDCMLPIPFYHLNKSVESSLSKKKHSKTLRTSTCFQRWTLFDTGKKHEKSTVVPGWVSWQANPLTNRTLFGVQTLRGVPECFNRACTLCKFVKTTINHYLPTYVHLPS